MQNIYKFHFCVAGGKRNAGMITRGYLLVNLYCRCSFRLIPDMCAVVDRHNERLPIFLIM